MSVAVVKGDEHFQQHASIQQVIPTWHHCWFLRNVGLFPMKIECKRFCGATFPGGRDQGTYQSATFWPDHSLLSWAPDQTGFQLVAFQAWRAMSVVSKTTPSKVHLSMGINDEGQTNRVHGVWVQGNLFDNHEKGALGEKKETKQGRLLKARWLRRTWETIISAWARIFYESTYTTRKPSCKSMDLLKWILTTVPQDETFCCICGLVPRHAWNCGCTIEQRDGSVFAPYAIAMQATAMLDKIISTAKSSKTSHTRCFQVTIAFLLRFKICSKGSTFQPYIGLEKIQILAGWRWATHIPVNRIQALSALIELQEIFLEYLRVHCLVSVFL